MQWVLGEKRYIYTTVSSASGESFTVSSAICAVYDLEDEGVVASGVASISDHTLAYLWEPSEVGNYIARFSYIISLETFKSDQVIEVRETM